MSITISEYAFEGPYLNTESIKNESGLYTILDKRSDGKWSVIDVGESQDLKTRIDNHDRKTCWETNRQGQLGVAVLYTPGWRDDQRRSLESTIRDSYSPTCGVR